MKQLTDIRLDGLKPKRVQTVKRAELPVRNLPLPSGHAHHLTPEERAHSARLAEAVFNYSR